MKPKLKQYHLLLLLFIICSLSKAQNDYRNLDAAKIIKGANRVVFKEKNTSPYFVVLNKSEFVSEINHLSWLKNTVLKINANYNLKLVKKESDNLGYTHYRYQEYYKDVKVEFGVYYVHIKDGRVVSANGEFFNDINLNTKPSVSYTQANKNALKHFKYENGTLNTSGNDKQLRVLRYNGQKSVCYKIELYSQNPLKKSAIFVDAETGKIVFEEEKIHTSDETGTAYTAYSGTQTITTDQFSAGNYRLRETGRGGGINTLNCQNNSSTATAVDFTNSGNVWSAGSIVDKAVFDLHYGLEKTYDYFNTTFGRNSYDNMGAVMNGYTHYGSGFNNAFWKDRKSVV